MSLAYATVDWVTNREATVFARTTMGLSSGASLAATGPGKVQNASSSASTQKLLIQTKQDTRVMSINPIPTHKSRLAPVVATAAVTALWDPIAATRVVAYP
ncbi:MAG: hypothetical protein Q9224_005591 [Gallowayella concinna]